VVLSLVHAQEASNRHLDQQASMIQYQNETISKLEPNRELDKKSIESMFETLKEMLSHKCFLFLLFFLLCQKGRDLKPLFFCKYVNIKHGNYIQKEVLHQPSCPYVCFMFAFFINTLCW